MLHAEFPVLLGNNDKTCCMMHVCLVIKIKYVACAVLLGNIDKICYMLLNLLGNVIKHAAYQIFLDIIAKTWCMLHAYYSLVI